MHVQLMKVSSARVAVALLSRAWLVAGDSA
jgi:hypothetical protein